MTDGYKQPITSTYDARWNLCREIDEFGKLGSPSMTLLMFYFMSSAWWGDKFGKKRQGQVDPKHGKPSAVERYTGLAHGSVVECMARLEDDGWINVQINRREYYVTVLLDNDARSERLRRRVKDSSFGKRYRKKSESDNGGQNLTAAVRSWKSESDSDCDNVVDLGKRRSRI